MLLDHCDNAASGGSMDNTTVLAEILRQGLDNVAFYAIYDPDAAQQAARAGVGQTVTLSLGGKIQAPRCASPTCRWRSRAASSWCSTACTAAAARWGAARSTTPG